MKDQIKALDNKTAINILGKIASAHMRNYEYETELSIEIKNLLETTFAIENESVENVTEGDLARQALLVLADNDEFNLPLSSMLKGYQDGSFLTIDPASIVVATAALVVLQTHIKIERKPNGKVSILIEKKPAKDSLLLQLVKKLLGNIEQ